jgi:presequence protease
MSEMFGFTLLAERQIPEINTLARFYRHERTGAQLLSLENDDENKVFAITFRTPPPDSTGLPHIMEHSVLCGSKKYPLKEPFIELVKGSLNTFLNAFTYPDKTCYPVASQNLQDFYNLVDVYVDAVFHPLLAPTTLQQEGWHYELESLDAPLTLKGVVFNEMKGALSDPDDLLGDEVRFSLFPNHPYGVNSGGDPRYIPDLTYDAFKAFHARYYHPSNAWIFFYGNDDPQVRLQRMQAYLDEFESLDTDRAASTARTSSDSAIPLQPRFVEPRRTVVPFDPGDDPTSARGQLVVNWLLDDSNDPQTSLALTILAHILIGTPASPLRKALIDSGLGEDLAGSGLETSLRQGLFSIGLKGLAVDSADNLLAGKQVEQLIWDTLRSLAKDGIDPEQIAASLNTVEFHLRENNTGHFPRGLALMLRSLTTWLYDQDPLVPLAFEAPLAAIRERLGWGDRLFEDLIQRFFLYNQHHTVVILQPEPGYSQRKDEEEAHRLAVAKSMMSPAELERIMASARRLQQIQQTPDSPEALASLPGLKLADLERQNRLIPLESSQFAGCQLLYHDLFTNGILYLDLGFDLHLLPQELLPYIPLFGRALLEMGTETQDFVRLSQRIGVNTGGIRPTHIATTVRNQPQSAAWLILRSKVMASQASELFSILRDILLTPRLDNQERFRQIVLEYKAGMEASLLPGGHRLVNSRLRAHFNEAGWVEEQMGGLEALFFLRDLARRVDSDWPGVLEQLETIRRLLVNRNAMLCNATQDAAGWKNSQPLLAAFLEALPAAAAQAVSWTPGAALPYEGLAIPAQVNFVGKGANLFDFGYRPHGSASVITKYLDSTWLWERVRVQGGAYGGFSVFNHRSGVFTFLSYRDPNILDTLKNFDETARFLNELDLSPEELERGIIGAIGDLDAYQLPDAKGFTSLVWRLTKESDEDRQRWREQILGTTLADFRHFGAALEPVREKGLVSILGSAEALNTANAERLASGQVRLEIRPVFISGQA